MDRHDHVHKTLYTSQLTLEKEKFPGLAREVMGKVTVVMGKVMVAVMVVMVAVMVVVMVAVMVVEEKLQCLWRACIP